MTKKIYLVSENGYAIGNTEKGAQALEAVGYRRCSKEEYRRQMRKVSSKDEQAYMLHLEGLDAEEAA